MVTIDMLSFEVLSGTPTCLPGYTPQYFHIFISIFNALPFPTLYIPLFCCNMGQISSQYPALGRELYWDVFVSLLQLLLFLCAVHADTSVGNYGCYLANSEQPLCM